MKNHEKLEIEKNGSADEDSKVEKDSRKYLCDKSSVSEVYHSLQNQEKSQIIYTNVADIKLIPNTSEAKIVDIKVKLRSQTMNISRQFNPKNAATVRTLHSILLNMFFLEFVRIVKDDAVLPMIGNLYQFLPSTCSCQSPECNELSSLSAPYTKHFLLIYVEPIFFYILPFYYVNPHSTSVQYIHLYSSENWKLFYLHKHNKLKAFKALYDCRYDIVLFPIISEMCFYFSSTK